MYARRRLDITWRDLLYAVCVCADPRRTTKVQNEVERIWSPAGEAVISFSVRTGFDAFLTALSLPRGSEVLVSAVTIAHMIQIIEKHGLVAVPIDLELKTLSFDIQILPALITSHTRAILIAPLFGSLISMEPIIEMAKRYNLLVIEDCAQAYRGLEYRGHPETDLTLFSFGPIKTATALGGALLRIKDAKLRSMVREIQGSYTIQSRLAFLKKIIKFALLKLLSYPLPYGTFTKLCTLLRRDYDTIIARSVRGFGSGDIFSLIKQQPCLALLRLLKRNLLKRPAGGIARRGETAQKVLYAISENIHHPGELAKDHTFWVVPVVVEQPALLISTLKAIGFDATQGASNMCVVDAPSGHERSLPRQAKKWMSEIVYLPVYPDLSPRTLKRLVQSLRQYSRN